MRKKLATLALVGALGMTGAAGAALLAPAISYAATGDSSALTERVSRIADDLKGLVSDGTITQDQADKVATVIAESRPEPGLGGPGMGIHGKEGMAAAATALGLSEDDLRTELHSGKSLGAIADEKGVDRSVLVTALVDAAKAHLAEEVTEGKLTQEQADERAATLETRITEGLDEVRPAGPAGGPHGHHGGPRAESDQSDQGDQSGETQGSSSTESSSSTSANA